MTTVEAPVVEPRTFNATDRAILEFERLHWKRTGRKVDEIKTRFELTEVRYYQVLNWIIDQPEALAYDAVFVNQLRNLRAKRADVRTRGTTATGVETRPDVRGTRPALLGGVV
jgi:hypothetical protein